MRAPSAPAGPAVRATVAALAVVVALLGACSKGDDGAQDADTATEEGTTDPADMEPADFFPSPQEMRERSQDAADCARKEGVSVEVDPGGEGVYPTGTDSDDQDVVDRCAEAVGLYPPEPNAEQRAGIYDLLVEQARCIEEETGLDLQAPPSKQVFTSGAGDAMAWSPTTAWAMAKYPDQNELPPRFQQELEEMLETCPVDG